MKRYLQQIILLYLRFWARKALAKHRPTIIGIAGSVGKSSTRNAIEAILKDHFPTKTVGNSETGIPLGILGMNPEDYTKIDWAKMLVRAPLRLDFLKGTKYLIAEMGIDDPFPPKNMEYLLTILKPDIAVSLNVSATHTMQFEKTLGAKRQALSEDERLAFVIQKIAEEDTKIITQSNCYVGIYNADDDNIAAAIKQVNNASNQDLLTFGTKSSNDVSYGLYKVSLQGTSFQLYIKNREVKDITLTFPHHLLPREYREVFAAAILAALQIPIKSEQTGLSLEQIQTSLEKHYTLPKGRSSLFHGINGSVIIDSTYNASKTAVEAFLDLVDTLKKETNRPVFFLFGDMRELGKESKIEHEAIAAKMLGIVDYLYLVGPQTREYVLPVIQRQETLFKEIRWFDNAIRAGDYMKDNLPKNAIVLAKGSQNTIFLEEAVKQILADKKDRGNLCRQEAFWMKVKRL